MIRFLLEKEFKITLRNPLIIRLVIMMPIVMMGILPLASNLEVRNIRLSIVDGDHTATSRELIEQIISSGYFSLTGNAESYQAAMGDIESGLSDIIMTIPPDFAKNLLDGAACQISLAANSVDATKAGMGSSYLQTIIQSYALKRSPLPAVPEVNITSRNNFNPMLNYKFYMVPALMVMLLTIICGSLPALNIVTEKQNGTIEQMNVTPVGRFQFIFAKVLPYWVIGFIILTICFVISWALYGLVALGSYATIYAAAMLFIIAITGFGLLISNYSSTLQQAMFVMFFFLIIMILLSGLFTPIQSMPTWAQNITIFNPLRYFIQVTRGVYLKGSDIADLWHPVVALVIFGVVLNSWAIISYRKKS